MPKNMILNVYLYYECVKYYYYYYYCVKYYIIISITLHYVFPPINYSTVLLDVFIYLFYFS